MYRSLCKALSLETNFFTKAPFGTVIIICISNFYYFQNMLIGENMTNVQCVINKVYVINCFKPPINFWNMFYFIYNR